MDNGLIKESLGEKTGLVWVSFIRSAFVAGIILSGLGVWAYLTDSAHLLKNASLLIETTFDPIIFICAFISARRFVGAWRLVFLLLGIEAAIYFLITWYYYIFLHVEGVAPALFVDYPYTLIKIAIFIIRPFFLSVLVVSAMRKLKANFRVLIPTIPTLLIIMLVIIYSIWMYIKFHTTHQVQDVSIINTCQDLIIFLCLLYVIPIAKNRSLLLLLISFLMLVMGEIFGVRSGMLVPYYVYLNPSMYFWVFGNLLLIESLIKVIGHNNININSWFYRIDSLRVQIAYWGNSIIALLFLFISIRSLMLLSGYKIVELLFHMNTVVFIFIISIISLIIRPFLSMFSHDFDIIRDISRSSKNIHSLQKINPNELYFAELRHLAKLLKTNNERIIIRSDKQNKVFHFIKRVVKNIKPSLKSLKSVSRETSKALDANENDIYQAAVATIGDIGNDLVTFESKIYLGNIKIDYQFQYLGVFFNYSLKEILMQFANTKIKININISKDAWYFLAVFKESDFHRVLSNLVNNAVDAGEGEGDRTIICSLEYVDNIAQVKLSVRDFGCGMSPEQVNSILQGKIQTTKKEGHGLGLRFVLNKIAQWNCRLQVESEQGVGTVFEICFPKIKPLPVWWMDRIQLSSSDNIVIYAIKDQQLPQLMGRFLQIPSLVEEGALEYCYTESKLIECLYREERIKFFIEINDPYRLSSALPLLKENASKNDIVVLSDNYQSQVIQNLCRIGGFLLLPNPLVKRVVIEVDGERCD